MAPLAVNLTVTAVKESGVVYVKDIRAERMKILGDNLSTIRKAKGFSRQQLAAVVNVADNTIAAYETEKKLPPLDKIFELANFLEVSVVDLIGDNQYTDRIPNIDEIINKKTFEYRYNRAVQLLTSARFKIIKSKDGGVYLTPPMEFSTEQGDDGKIKVFVEYNIAKTSSNILRFVPKGTAAPSP